MADRVDRETGGFEAEFVLPLPEEYECPICQLAFRDPVQIEDCGHRFCQSCLQELKRRYIFSTILVNVCMTPKTRVFIIQKSPMFVVNNSAKWNRVITLDYSRSQERFYGNYLSDVVSISHRLNCENWINPMHAVFKIYLFILKYAINVFILTKIKARKPMLMSPGQEADFIFEGKCELLNIRC